MFAADTNVYLEAARDADFRADFGRFALQRGVPVLSSVVAAEILLGTQRNLQAAALGALGAASAIVAPGHADWLAAAAAVARLEHGGSKSRSFWNDALLAAQCARLHITLITSNLDDFRRLRRELAVEFVAPFPR